MTEIFFIEVEKDYAVFLGIDIRKTEDGKLELSQTCLVIIIISALGINYETTNTSSKTAATKTLAKYENGDTRK